MNKKLKKMKRKQAKLRRGKSLDTQPEFSNSSPMRGLAYAVKGAFYGW